MHHDATAASGAKPAGEGQDKDALANLSTFDGTHLAIAAARNHVAVAWLSMPKLTAGDPTGGWALSSCPK